MNGFVGGYVFNEAYVFSATIYNDAVTAYAVIKRYRTTEYAMGNSGWTLLDSAEQVFKLSKERVYNEQGGELFTPNDN